MRARSTRTKEELLLLVVSAGAAAVVVNSILRDVPASPALQAATAVALVLSLVTAFAFWFAGATRRAVSSARRGEQVAARRVLSALPDGVVVVGDGRVLSVNRRFCALLGFERDELVGATAPFPFWPPERKHEIERWHTTLEARGELVGPLVLLHGSGDRIPVLVAGGVVSGGEDDSRYVLTVRDVSASHRRARRLSALSTHDPATALLNERGFEDRLRDAVRRAIAGGTNTSVALIELGVDVESPEGLIAIDRLRALVRAGEDLARTKRDELAWILHDTGRQGAAQAVRRAQHELTEATGITLTAGISDLVAASDALSLYALADRALVAARRQGRGVTVCYPDCPGDGQDELARRRAS
jgi:PAS domain S-box-containing protein